MIRYHIPVGTMIYRMRYELHDKAAWFLIMTKRAATYTEADVITHGTKDVGWVFKLPKWTYPYTHISVKSRDLIIDGDGEDLGMEPDL